MPGDDLYRDPRLYDLEYAGQAEDVVYYSRMAREVGGPVLELGCGNGRITLPIARGGTQVVGVDNAGAMVEDLLEKLVEEPEDVRSRVSVERGSFLELDQPPRFPLVMLPFNALHHCGSHHDVLALLQGVRGALAPGGRFVLDCYLPDPQLYARDRDKRYEPRDFIDPRTGGRLQTWEAGWYDPLQQVHHVVYIYRDSAGAESRVRLDLRMFYPQELLALLDWGGFRVLSQHEDFRGSPLCATSLKWVGVLEAR